MPGFAIRFRLQKRVAVLQYFKGMTVVVEQMTCVVRHSLGSRKLPRGEQVLIGYFYGGIRSTAQQINGFNPSFASSTTYEVDALKK